MIRAAKGGAELAQLRWGLSPGRPKGRPVINMRSEGRAFERGRCLVPASHFFEFTGDKSPKTKWRFTKLGEDWFCFAGVWGPADEGQDGPGRFALLTTSPGPDDRQPVILDRERWAEWLDPRRLAAPMLIPSPAGTLAVKEMPRRA